MKFVLASEKPPRLILDQYHRRVPGIPFIGRIGFLLEIVSSARNGENPLPEKKSLVAFV
jgi:hypothetical protein